MSLDLEQELDRCRKDTEFFWDDTASLGELARYRRYISELLPRELDLARRQGPERLPDPEQLPGEQCDVLVLLVGHSFEPLLQAICAYKPLVVVPVVNKLYGPSLRGEEMTRRLGKLLPHLARTGLIDHEPAFPQSNPLEEDTPSAVFRFLLQQFRPPPEEEDGWQASSIVVDITGAKKSMVAGAFFFAAYSNTPISYVDFDLYDERRGRPYGYTCRIGLIDNPYRDFGLRDWARVQRLYGQYAFSAAHLILAEICEEMEHSDLFRPVERRAARNLLAALEILQAWDSGDYHQAAREALDLEGVLPAESLPWAIDVLGEIWPYAPEGASADPAAIHLMEGHLKLKYGDPDPEESLFARPKALLAYVEDELAKIEHLVHRREEFRAAYLRAAGLEEFLLKARLALCWLKGDLISAGRPVTRERLGSARWRDYFTALTESYDVFYMREVLLRSWGKTLRLDREQPNSWLELAPTAPRMSRFWVGKPLDLDRVLDRMDRLRRPIFVRLRGEAVHTHLFLNKTLAEAALALVQAAKQEFLDNWLYQYHPEIAKARGARLTEAPEWEELCGWCGVDFLPPYREEE